MNITLIRQPLAAQLLGVSESTLKTLRKRNKLIVNIHWRYTDTNRIYYHRELLEDYLANGDNERHQMFCQNYLTNFNKGKVKAKVSNSLEG